MNISDYGSAQAIAIVEKGIKDKKDDAIRVLKLNVSMGNPNLCEIIKANEEYKSSYLKSVEDSLVNEYVYALTTCNINAEKIILLRTKINYISPQEKANQTMFEKLKSKCQIFFIGKGDSSSGLSVFPKDVFYTVFSFNVEIFKLESCELNIFNKCHDVEVENLKRKIARGMY
jgi:hypothetical protein